MDTISRGIGRGSEGGNAEKGGHSPNDMPRTGRGMEWLGRPCLVGRDLFQHVDQQLPEALDRRDMNPLVR